jgi:mono/diheme cytochrome c family protein
MPPTKYARILVSCVALGYCIAADAQSIPEREPSRGELLYSTHCIACHTTEVHWRNQRLATDWATLTRQVRRWQGNAHLDWNDEDILAVTRYLNGLYYHYPAGPEEKAVTLNESKAQQASKLAH